MVERLSTAWPWTLSAGLGIVAMGRIANVQRLGGREVAAALPSGVACCFSCVGHVVVIPQTSYKAFMAAGLAVFVSLYQMMLAPLKMKTNDYHDPYTSRSKAVKSRYFPPGFPNGWHCVCNTYDLERGKVKSISALGQFMVAFRGEDGRVGVLDAFCPHLGAHLGVGGKVLGNFLRCPFHGWAFDATGRCANVPYRDSKRELPQSARTKAYEVRVILDRVFIWFDAEGRPPQWELQCHNDVERGLADGSYYFARMRTTEFHMHSCEMHMNSADPYHFKTLHGAFSMPVLEYFITGNHEISQVYGKAPHPLDGTMIEQSHLSSFKEWTTGLFLFGNTSLPVPFSKAAAASVDTSVTFEGPTIIHFTVKTVFGTVRQIKTLLPVEPFRQAVEVRWYAEWTVPRAVVWFLATYVAGALEQDRAVWENKIWRPTPNLVGGDGPFLEFYKYYWQFYSESSANVGRHGLEW